MPKERGTDDRDFDMTQLHEKGAGKNLHRDYSAHFFRWSWVSKFVTSYNRKHGKKNTARILEIGCGQEAPLPNLLVRSPTSAPGIYVGVDLNNRPRKIRDGGWRRYHFNFNFVKSWKTLEKEYGRFDIIACLEVIEHMQPAHGKKLLKAAFKLLDDDGAFLLSTPVFNGKQANNHIHEYTVEELQKLIESTGFKVVKRFGTFGNVPILKREIRKTPGRLEVWDALSEYFSHDAMSCFFAPLYPDHTRNNLWWITK